MVALQFFPLSIHIIFSVKIESLQVIEQRLYEPPNTNNNNNRKKRIGFYWPLNLKEP